jgi:18S rRNA (guanine1575-N7)-methyltransferase
VDGENSQSEAEVDSDEGEDEGAQVDMLERQRPSKRIKQSKVKTKGKAWLLKKKEQRRKMGVLNVPLDTKYTGRKRKTRF